MYIIPDGYFDLSDWEKENVLNGCGSKNSKFIPDNILGLCINEACLFHDYMYYVGTTDKDKREADKVFLNNILWWVDEYSRNFFLRWGRRFIAKIYYYVVKVFGEKAFFSGLKRRDNVTR